MGFQANVLRVMIASPGDVNDERRIVTEEMHRWNDAHAVSRKLMLQPVKWETHSTPELGAPPQSVLNKQILEDADILIGIFGTRVGTPTEEYVSGTVEEIKRHVLAGKTAKVYFSDIPKPPSQIDSGQYQALQKFKEQCRSSGLYATYDSLDRFREIFQQHLAIELNQPRYLWIATLENYANNSEPQLTENEKRFLVAAADRDGEIFLSSTLDGETIRAGAVRLTDGTARSIAIWSEVLEGLLSSGLVQSIETGSGAYRLTAKGFRAADAARLEEENKKQFEIDLTFAGTPPGQALVVKSNKPVHLKQLEFLTTSEVCTAHCDLNTDGTEASLPIDQNDVVKLFNAPRPDRNHNDHSGPALLRLTYSRVGQTKSIDLPVSVQPIFRNTGAGSTQYIALAGQKRFYA